jgi:hypothetical protein
VRYRPAAASQLLAFQYCFHLVQDRARARLDNSEGALLPTEPLTDPRLDSRPVRIDATRTAYSGYPLPHQPSPEASTVCFVLPRAQPVTRDSRNRATRARHMKRVRSPYMQPLEEERPNFHIKCGNTRTASRTPDTYTIFQLGLMNQDAGTASSIHREPGPCTVASSPTDAGMTHRSMLQIHGRHHANPLVSGALTC